MNPLRKYIDIVNHSNESIPEITISPENSEWDRIDYMGVTVDFEVSYDGKMINVMDITSRIRGKGNAKAALEYLKSIYPTIVTTSVIEDSDDAKAFWVSMVKSGVVDKAVTTDGIELK